MNTPDKPVFIRVKDRLGRYLRAAGMPTIRAEALTFESILEAYFFIESLGPTYKFIIEVAHE